MKLFLLVVAIVVALSITSGTWLSSPVSAQEVEGDECRSGTCFHIESIVVSPNDPSIGDVVNVLVSIVSFASSTPEHPIASSIDHTLELSVNGTVVDSQIVQLSPNPAGESQLPAQKSKEVLLSFVASEEGPQTIAVGNIKQALIVADQDKKSEMRVSPTVRLQVNRTVVSKDQDALIDIFWDNSSLNEKDIEIEVLVQVPTGLYLHSEIGAIACSAGTCKGLFKAPPGSTRNMPIIVKADAVGDYFLNMNGRYWPKGEPDAWNPVNLSTPIYVTGASQNPKEFDAAENIGAGVPGTVPDRSISEQAPVQIQSSTPSEQSATRWWLDSQALVLWLIITVVIITIVAFIALKPNIRVMGSA